MTTQIVNGITHLLPAENAHLTNGDVYSTDVILGANDSAENWSDYFGEIPTAVAWTEETLGAMTNPELVAILDSYGISGSMTKANMVRLILDAQGGEDE